MIERRHVWISNTAFTRITGVRKVCMDCGQTNLTATKVCPGKRQEETRR